MTVPNAVSESAVERPSSKASKKIITTTVWFCDVCGVASFEKFEDACRHEEECQKEQDALREKKGSDAGAPIHPFFNGGTKSKPKHDSNKAKRRAPKNPRKKEAANSNPSIDSTDRGNALSVDSSVDLTTRKPRLIGAGQKRVAPSEEENVKRNPRRALNTKENGVVPIMSKSRAASQKSVVSRPAKPKPKATKAPLAPIFGKMQNGPRGKANEMDAVLVQHQFAMKRQAEAEQERERQRKRNKNQHLKLSKAQVDHIDENSKRAQRVSMVRESAPRFPVPSHVLGVSPIHFTRDQKGTCGLAGETMVSRAAEALCKTARHPSGICNTTTECYKNLLPRKGHDFHCSAHESDHLRNAMGLLLTPPAKRGSDGDVRLWSDKYAMQNLPNDVCGEANREASMELVNFVEEWKTERQKALERMAEKRLLLLSKKRKRKAKYDDLWEDSDEDDSLVNVCVLSGPSGSGKTSLVHAVAKQTGCIVLEINSTDRRGGQALKHSIEEATQSHSSLAMLRQNGNSTEDNVFSDDEEETEKQAANVVMILIDEIDNVFENDGDSGFWTALSGVTKKAKCPIFMTANRIPDQLLASKIRFSSVSTSLPTPMECATKMWMVISAEGFKWKKSHFPDGVAAKQQLSHIAELCGCDLRLIILELQLYSYSNDECLQRNGSSARRKESDSISFEPSYNVINRPLITDFLPKCVGSNQHTVLTIKGKNFLGLPSRDTTSTSLGCADLRKLSQGIEVLIGDQICPAMQVLDDETIMAVCPPCRLPAGVDNYGVFQSTLEECLSCRYAPLSVNFRHRIGVISTAESPLNRTSGWNIEYCFPSEERGRLNPGQASSSTYKEAEFMWGEKRDGHVGSSSDKPREMSEDRRPDTRDDESLGVNHAKEEQEKQSPQELLDKRVAEWKQTNKEVLVSDMKRNWGDPNCEIYEYEQAAQCVSDAALLEDSLEGGGIPCLSGAARGFGYHLTSNMTPISSDSADPNRLCRNPNEKPPGYERLFSLGWNDTLFFHGNSETYVTAPATHREKRLLKNSEAFARGMCLSESDDVAPPSSPGLVQQSGSQLDGTQEQLVLGEGPTQLGSEEDMFLSCDTPSSLLLLPSILREGRVRSCRNRMEPDDDFKSVFRFKKDQAAHSLINTLKSVFKEEEILVYWLGLERETNFSTYLHHEVKDSPLFLDYAPMLRIMAAHECAAEETYREIAKANPEAVRSGRRSTRRSKQLGRRSYFDRAFDTLGQSNGEVVKQLCTELANTVLEIETPE